MRTENANTEYVFRRFVTAVSSTVRCSLSATHRQLAIKLIAEKSEAIGCMC